MRTNRGNNGRAFRGLAPQHIRRVPHPGFTLIELLVVIAVIAVLASLLLPALARAKGAARRIQCVSQMKQWCLGFLMYTHENENNFLPREGFHWRGEVFNNNWAQVQHQAARDVWYNVLAPYVNWHPASWYAYDNKLEFYAPGNFLQCPSARFPKETRSYSYQVAIFSLAMNSQLINPPYGTVRMNDSWPNHTALFLDGLLDGEVPVVPEQANQFLGQPGGYANRFAGMRHLGMGNIGFKDGRVESLAGNKVVETQGPYRGWDIEPPVDVIWDPDVPRRALPSGGN